MTSSEMTERERALLAYFYTVATDKRVRAAGASPERVLGAFYACLADDFPAVLKVVLQGTVRIVGERASAALTERGAHPAVAGIVGDVFARFEEAISGSSKKTKR